MHKREFVMVFVGFFACFGLSVFIGLAGKHCRVIMSYIICFHAKVCFSFSLRPTDNFNDRTKGTCQ